MSNARNKTANRNAKLTDIDEKMKNMEDNADNLAEDKKLMESL